MHKRRVTLVFTPFTVLMLLAQLVLAAAHLHRGATHGGEAGSIATHPGLHHDGAPISPADDGEAHCPLCWAQTVVGSLPVPARIALPFSHASLSEPLAASTQAPSSKVWPGDFRPRAPPPSVA